MGHRVGSAHDSGLRAITLSGGGRVKVVKYENLHHFGSVGNVLSDMTLFSDSITVLLKLLYGVIFFLNCLLFVFIMFSCMFLIIGLNLKVF